MRAAYAPAAPRALNEPSSRASGGSGAAPPDSPLIARASLLPGRRRRAPRRAAAAACRAAPPGRSIRVRGGGRGWGTAPEVRSIYVYEHPVA